MKQIFTIAALLLIASSFAAAQTTTQGKVEKELREIQQQLHDATIVGDKAAIERLTADDYIGINLEGEVSDKTGSLKNLVDSKIAGEIKATETLSDVQVRDYGDTAVLNCISERAAQFGVQKLTARRRVTSVFRRRNGQWQLVVSHITLIPEMKAPTIAKIDVKLLDEYTGQYELGARTVSTVLREGDKLFIYDNDPKNREEWLPENETVFFSKGSKLRTIFVRDASGKVSHLTIRFPNGQEINAKKIK